MKAMIAAPPHPPTATDTNDAAIEIRGKFCTLRISDAQLRAYAHDRLELDEETGARGAVGVRPIDLAANLLKKMIQSATFDFEISLSAAVEARLWPAIRTQLPA